MTTKELTQEVEEWIAEHEPASQDELKVEFGRGGLAAVAELMETDRVKYDLQWDLVIDERSHQSG